MNNSVVHQRFCKFYSYVHSSHKFNKAMEGKEERKEFKGQIEQPTASPSIIIIMVTCKRIKFKTIVLSTTQLLQLSAFTTHIYAPPSVPK